MEVRKDNWVKIVQKSDKEEVKEWNGVGRGTGRSEMGTKKRKERVGGAGKRVMRRKRKNGRGATG